MAVPYEGPRWAAGAGIRFSARRGAPCTAEHYQFTGEERMNIAIYGSGGAGKEVFDLLAETPEERRKWEEIVFIDDTVPSGEYWSCRRFTFEDFQKDPDCHCRGGTESPTGSIRTGEGGRLCPDPADPAPAGLCQRQRCPRRRRGAAGRRPGFAGNGDG